MSADLVSRRLRLEPLRAEHTDVVWPHQNDPALYTYQPDDPLPLDALARRYGFLAGAKSPDGQEDWLNWVAFQRTSGQAVGTFQATVPAAGDIQLAYMVFSAHWRQGYGGEMATTVIEHLFARYRDRAALSAEIDTRNAPSIALVERQGFTRVKTTLGADHFKGASSDEFTYRMTRAMWLARA